MDTFKTGFIGCGNMAAAIINGILNKNILPAADIYVYDIDSKKAEQFGGVNVCTSIGELAEQAQILFLCVKPNVIENAAAEIKSKNKAVISIAAGVKTARLAFVLPENTRIMRIMPNTPLMVGKGASCVQAPNGLTLPERTFVYRIFSALGLLEEVEEQQMDAVTGVSGSGPAYVYLFVDAVAAAGEANGLDRETALRLAVQTFEGACAMLRTTGKPPEQLIQEVCSPGGTTVEAMKVFEAKDVRGIVREAVDACVERSRELSE